MSFSALIRSTTIRFRGKCILLGYKGSSKLPPSPTEIAFIKLFRPLHLSAVNRVNGGAPYNSAINWRGSVMHKMDVYMYVVVVWKFSLAIIELKDLKIYKRCLDS